jgi:hypothetical protein
MPADGTLTAISPGGFGNPFGAYLRRTHHSPVCSEGVGSDFWELAPPEPKDRRQPSGPLGPAGLPKVVPYRPRRASLMLAIQYPKRARTGFEKAE